MTTIYLLRELVEKEAWIHYRRWIVFDATRVLPIKRKASKNDALARWQKVYGSYDKLIEYTEVFSSAEAAATIADIQTKKESNDE
jgi:hypothetical protein